jgi:hypothetical protein
MCAFQCDSCIHKQVCSDEPNTRALNEECALYTNVKKFTDVQQLQAKIAAVVSDMQCCQPSLYPVYWSEYVNKLRQLSAVQ